jgi:hypothetical protein
METLDTIGTMLSVLAELKEHQLLSIFQYYFVCLSCSASVSA